MPSRAVVRVCHEGGACAPGRVGLASSLAPGKAAEVMQVSLDDPCLYLVHDPHVTLVFATVPDNVRDVGQIVACFRIELTEVDRLAVPA